MAEKTPVKIRAGIGKDVTLLKKYMTLEILDLDDADTVTVSQLTTIDNAKVINLSNGNDITVNTSTNVITVNDITATNVHALIIAVGN